MSMGDLPDDLPSRQAYFWHARSQAGSRLQAPGYSVHMFQACTPDANDTASLNYLDAFRTSKGGPSATENRVGTYPQ